MKQALLLIGILFISGCGLSAQHLMLFSQYVENSFLLNPAVAGSQSYSPMRLTIRRQWLGIEGGPKTQAFSYNTNLGRPDNICPVNGNPFSYRNNKAGVGLGGYLFRDSYGAVSRTGLELSYAYHIQLTRQTVEKPGTKLSLGLGGLFYQHKFDGRNIPIDDPMHTGIIETSYFPNANIGVYLYSNNYFMGFSVARLFQTQIKPGGKKINNIFVKRQFYAMAGYTFHFPGWIDLEPAVIARQNSGSDMDFDILSKLYVQNFWIAFSYRTNKQYVGMIGLNFDRFYFGYSYDYYVDNLVADNSSGTHEITLGINFNVPADVLKRNQSIARRISYKAFSRSQRKTYRRNHRKFLFF